MPTASKHVSLSLDSLPFLCDLPVGRIFMLRDQNQRRVHKVSVLPEMLGAPRTEYLYQEMVLNSLF